MDDLEKYFKMVADMPEDNNVAIDKCHNMFLMGSLLSKKPLNVLEIGIGTGFVTWTLIYGIRYNQKGKLICVDNWLDWGGKEPPFVSDIRKTGTKIISPVKEESFLNKSTSDKFDLVVCDADHFNSGNLINEYLRVTKNEGFMFFHDTNQNDLYPNLALIEKRIKELNLPYYHFKESSRKEENCERGWLFAINKKLIQAVSSVFLYLNFIPWQEVTETFLYTC